MPSDKVSKRKIKKIKKELKKNKMVYVRKKVDFSENFVELKAGNAEDVFFAESYDDFYGGDVTSVCSLENNKIYKLVILRYGDVEYDGIEYDPSNLVV